MSPAGSPARPLRLRPGLEWREVEGEIVALDLDRSVYLAANRTGAGIWQLLSEGTTREALIDSLVVAYGLERPTAVNDVNAVLADLEAQGCLELNEGR
jgi:hypothetical protein